MVDTTDRGEISSQTLDSHLKYIREIIVKEAIALCDKNRTEETNQAVLLSHGSRISGLRL